MEGRPEVSATLPRNRGATLPGYRVGSVRYDVRLAPQDGPGALLPTRRCSEGDLVTTARKNCVLEEGTAVDGVRNAQGHTAFRPLVNNGPTTPSLPSLRLIGTSGATLQEVTASPLPLKEAHSLVSHKLPVPVVSPLLPPVSPRPPAGRRSFNASPRPWVSPAPQAELSAASESPDNRGSDSSGVGGRWRVAPTDGVSVHTKSGSDTNPLKLSSNPPEANKSASLWGGARPAPPINSPVDATTFRSEATILVTQCDDAQAARRSSQGSRSPICWRRGVGALSLLKAAPSNEGEGMGAQRTAAPGAAAGGAVVVEEVRADGLPPPAAKYMCCVAGRSPRQLVPRHATMFSYPGPPRPAIPEEPASAHLTSDQRSAQPPTPPTHAHGRTVQCEVFSGGGGGSLATGGSGHGDRVAPPEPVTPQDSCGAAPSGLGERTSRRLVRPRPEIPDHLYRRWAALLPSDAGISYKHKPQQESVGGHGGVGPSGGPVAGPADEGARSLTSPDLSPASGGPPESPDYSVDFSSSSAARFRLGNSTGVLGGGRKEGGRGPPPSRPPRSRQDHLESLRKCTERLKTPSPDKKARADSAPPPDTSSACKGPESVPPRAKTKGRNNEPRSVVTRHPSLGKSPSLPPQLPSAKEGGDSKPSSPPTAKDQKDVGPQGGAREDEDVFKEDIAKLPPRPRPEPRLGISPRVIPFRSASVSQVDVTSDGPFSSRSSKSPTAIRLYPICTNYYFSNTLPRRKPAVADKEEGRSQDGPELHPPLAAAVSISDMTNVGAKTGSSQPEKLENKSKSESELSAAGLRASDGGSPKVDILVKDLRDNNNARGKKADSKEEPDEGGRKDKPKHLNVNEIELKCDQRGGNDSKQMASENIKHEMPSHSDGAQGVNKVDLEKSITESDAKTVQNVVENDCKTDITKMNNEQNLIDGEKNTSACVVDHKDLNVDDIANSKISIGISNETPQNVDVNSKSSENLDKERALGSDTQRGSDGDPGGQGLATTATSAPCRGDVAKTKGSTEGGDTVNDVAGIRTSVGEIPSLQGDVYGPPTSKKDSTAEAPRLSEEGAAIEGRRSVGDVTSPEFVLESGIEGHNDEVSVADRGDVSVLGKDGTCEVSGAPPGGEPPNSGGLVPPEDTLKSVHDPQEHKEISDVDPSALSNKISLVHNECPPPKSDIRLAEIPSEESSAAPRADAASVGEGKAPHAEGSGGQCTDRRQIECQVLQKEPRLSQCLVIKSGAREGEGDPLGVQGATSECRVMRSRPRLPREDSDGDSGEREPSRATYITQVSDEGIFEEEIKSQEPRDSSDSSSQDSVGVSQEPCEEAVEAAAASATEAPVRTGSRRRRKLTEEGSERSLTFPPPRKGSQADSIGYSSVESNGLRSLTTSGGYGDRGSSEEQRSSVSLAESFQSEASQPRDTHQLLIISESRPIDRAERKKKHHSDPSCERRGSTDALLYLSDPHLGNTTTEGEATRTSSKGVVSQASTDSEGRDERGEQPIVGVPRLTPQVMFSGHESDGSDYPPCRTPARNASPIPYLQDSDSGDRSAPRSPLGPRRYSKRPLRGPYGEMLEAEMSKSKSSSTYLTEDSYFRLREAKSCSPRPPSPASPAVMVEGTGRPSLIIPTTRSFDDSAISINYSNTSDRPLRRKISEETDPGATSPVGGTAWESDGEGTLSPPLSIGPVHQRTASSPCKLFSEGGFTSEEEQELVDYYSAATRLLAQQNQHQRTQQHRQQQQQQLQPDLTQQEHLGSELASEARQPGTHEHRHTPDHRHSHKRHRVSIVLSWSSSSLLLLKPGNECCTPHTHATDAGCNTLPTCTLHTYSTFLSPSSTFTFVILTVYFVLRC